LSRRRILRGVAEKYSVRCFSHRAPPHRRSSHCLRERELIPSRPVWPRASCWTRLPLMRGDEGPLSSI
jgi:hypothetical protein